MSFLKIGHTICQSLLNEPVSWYEVGKLYQASGIDEVSKIYHEHAKIYDPVNCKLAYKALAALHEKTNVLLAFVNYLLFCFYHLEERHACSLKEIEKLAKSFINVNVTKSDHQMIRVKFVAAAVIYGLTTGNRYAEYFTDMFNLFTKTQCKDTLVAECLVLILYLNKLKYKGSIDEKLSAAFLHTVKRDGNRSAIIFYHKYVKGNSVNTDIMQLFSNLNRC